MKSVELNKIDYNWIEFENKDSKLPFNHFGNKNDEGKILPKALLLVFITKTGYWIFIAKKYFYWNGFYYGIKLSNFKIEFLG